MATTHQSCRVLTTLEKSLYDQITHLAARDGVSLSQKLRDLVKESVELDEDADLSALVASRRRIPAKLIPHQEFWRKRGIK